jgi:hypothetical protein
MRIIEWHKKIRTYLHDVGEEVLICNPHDAVAIRGIVVEQVMPLEYPGEYPYANPEDLIYLPRTRTRGQASRKESYVVKLRNGDEDGGQLYFWVTRDCIKADSGNGNT